MRSPLLLAVLLCATVAKAEERPAWRVLVESAQPGRLYALDEAGQLYCSRDGGVSFVAGASPEPELVWGGAEHRRDPAAYSQVGTPNPGNSLSMAFSLEVADQGVSRTTLPSFTRSPVWLVSSQWAEAADTNSSSLVMGPELRAKARRPKAMSALRGRRTAINPRRPSAPVGRALCAHPHDPERLWVGTDVGLFTSNDGGLSLTPLTTDWAVEAIACLDVGVLAATERGVLWWHDSAEALDAQPARVAVALDDERALVGGDFGLKRFERGRLSALSTEPIRALVARDTKTLLAVRPDHTLLLSTDGGRRFQPVGSFGAPIVGLSATQSTLLAATADTLWLSRDEGQTWRKALTGQSFTGLAATFRLFEGGASPLLPSPAPSDDALARLNREAAVEPTAEQAIEAATARAGLALGALEGRARAAAWLPTLLAGAQWRDVPTANAYEGLYLFDGAAFMGRNDLRFEHFAVGVFARWELGGLASTGEGTAVDRRIQAVREGQAQLARTVASLYGERRRLLYDRAARTLPEPQERARQLKLDELSAHLSGLTGLSFSSL